MQVLLQFLTLMLCLIPVIIGMAIHKDTKAKRKEDQLTRREAMTRYMMALGLCMLSFAFIFLTKSCA